MTCSIIAFEKRDKFVHDEEKSSQPPFNNKEQLGAAKRYQAPQTGKCQLHSLDEFLSPKKTRFFYIFSQENIIPGPIICGRSWRPKEITDYHE
ncbi:uncharacterized protein LOC132710346 isoform X8 [Pantherophis guttatus]|uniref:Uncharacterized protein LOC132710346 isoform X8 n=1 Tax=Pantherophis guttatus TaxID=94885 RepID=A0ABM3Z1V7_PANGU|nr:uncharacterized protein LOC132710346 isoform X8 [Pantherophis guttatus]